MIWKDCYADYDENQKIIIIGNSRIEKRMRIRGAFLCTERILDRLNQKAWEGETACWQRSPVLSETELPQTTFETSVQQELTGRDPFLKAVLERKGSKGTVWNEFLIFPNIPFVFSQIFVKTESGISVGQAEEEELCNGIEIEAGSLGQKDVYCCEDTLDCVPLGNSHLEMECFTLFDKTDINDSLLERHTIPIFPRGSRELEGNIFRISDYTEQRSLILVKHSPTSSSALNRKNADIRINGNRYVTLLGNGVDFAAMPEGKVPYYACAAGVGTGDGLKELWEYQNAFSEKGAERKLFLMSNTWGDRNRDKNVCEEFVLQEIEKAHEIGVDIVQIDDGWQRGNTANSVVGGGVWEGFYRYREDFWSVDPQKFPNGLDAVVKRAREYGMEIGLWFAPDSDRDFENVEKDIEILWELYRRYGICYFKLDSIKIRSKLGEMRFLHLLEELTVRSSGEIRFNLDVTAEDRFGYLYQNQYGTIFVENRYTDWGNYYPHNTFRNLWSLAAVIPPRRLQMELLNHRRNTACYQGMRFAPSEYGMDYLFASVMPANPLVWMEVSSLAPEDAAVLSGIITLYKQYNRELYQTRVIPIGNQPNGMNFSGYLCLNPDQASGHLILFREETRQASGRYELPLTIRQDQLTVLYQSAPTEISCCELEIQATFSEQRSFIWMKFQRVK